MLGHPIGHSLSPVLHNAAYAALGLTDWTFEAIDCDQAGLAPLLAASPAGLIAGYACTMPLKHIALQVADSVSEQARAIGAANTLLPTPRGWHADNTDWIGIRDALAAAGIAGGDRAVVLGAGGTAQAAVVALAGLAGRSGPAELTVLVRDPERAGQLLATADRVGVQARVGRLGSVVPAELVISTLPPGAADQLELGVGPGVTVLDVIYAGWPTPLARRALAAGATVVSGAAMLLFQAARQVELMTGRAAPVEAMRAAIRAAAPGCGA